ncbi:hypothetical protein [Pseudomonas sp.]|uniref:hypothetical protein n=1 Tax=Pseudomonas sp. TaxID=306 RepID=UPI0028B10B34|nr:hypothetical protein [Pseudomonas sp.]
MMSLKDIILLVRGMEPIEAARLFAWTGVLKVAIASFSIFALSEDLGAIMITATNTPAVLSSNVETWENDQSIYRFSVTYKNHEGKKLTSVAYAYKITFDAAGIDKTTALFVDFGYAQATLALIRLYTENETLYDSSIRQMIEDKNDSIVFSAIAIFGTMGGGLLIGACFMYWQHHRSNASSCKSSAP